MPRRKCASTNTLRPRRLRHGPLFRPLFARLVCRPAVSFLRTTGSSVSLPRECVLLKTLHALSPHNPDRRRDHGQRSSRLTFFIWMLSPEWRPRDTDQLELLTYTHVWAVPLVFGLPRVVLRWRVLRAAFHVCCSKKQYYRARFRFFSRTTRLWKSRFWLAICPAAVHRLPPNGT